MRYLVLAAAVTLAACETDSMEEPGTTLTSEEAADVALEVAELGYEEMDASFAQSEFATAGAGVLAAPPVTYTQEFERTRPCRLGGQVVVAGTTVAEVDRENHNVVIETDATKTHEACVLPLRRSAHEIELNGAPNVAMSARFERQDGMPLGPQTMSFEGAVAWQVLESDRAGVCEIRVSVVWERTTEGGYRTVDGTVCGREIHSETTWSGGHEGHGGREGHRDRGGR
jgi:hypothetical protein